MLSEINKRGVSVMIGYILLIAAAIFMSILVYQWIKTYVPADLLSCPDGVSVSIKEISHSDNILNLTLRNNGRFSIAGYFIYATNDPNQELATIDLSQNLDVSSGGVKFGNAVLFAFDQDNAMKPDVEIINLFNLDNNISSVEIIPARFQEEGNKIRFVTCSDARIKERIGRSFFVEFVPSQITSLISWWKFDGDAQDSAGDNDGTIVGADCNVAGKIGKACSFDGADDYISMGNVPDLSFERTDTFSMFAWVKTTDTGGSIMSKMNQVAPHRGYDFYTNGRLSTILVNTWSWNALAEVGDSFINTNDWVHVGMTYDGSSSADGLKLYVNGQEDSTTIRYNSLSSTMVNSYSFQIGARNSEGLPFEGMIDDVMIFNEALEQSDIEEIYGYQGGGVCNPDCSGRVCGPDPVCGLNCPPGCEEGDVCAGTGQCVPPEECTDTCTSLGYDCNTWTICGISTNCGTCEVNEECSVIGQCVSSCGNGVCDSGEDCSCSDCDGEQANCGIGFVCEGGICDFTEGAFNSCGDYCALFGYSPTYSCQDNPNKCIPPQGPEGGIYIGDVEGANVTIGNNFCLGGDSYCCCVPTS